MKAKLVQVQRNQGSMLLARVGLTQEEIASRLHCGRSLVGHFLSGRRKPNPEMRVTMCRVWKLPVTAWDEAIEDAPPAAKRGRPAAKAAAAVEEPAAVAAEVGPAWGDSALRARARRIAAMVDSSIAEAEKGTPAERVKVAQRGAAALALLGKITGESLHVSEARLVKLPAWQRVQDRMVEALKPWPEALQAVGEALTELGAET